VTAGHTTRAERMAAPLARQVVRDLAAEHGACLRPVQLRCTEIDTGHVEQVLIPCGHTLASVCPSCAERARILRAAQCREGWHLDQEPVINPNPATEEQRDLITDRAEAQEARDLLAGAGLDVGELDEQIGELDEEIAVSGMRGSVLPARPRHHRSTRRRQDAAPLPRRPVSARTVGKTYATPDGKTFRPSLFVTLTCPSYGRVGEDGAPADPDTYDYQRAARDALHFAALFDRFIQNLRRYTGYDLQYFAAIEPGAASPRTSTSPSAAPSPAPNSARSSPPPTTRSGGHQPRPSGTAAGSCQCGMSTPAPTSTRTPARSCRPGTRPSTRREYLGYAGRRVLVSRKWSGKTLADHRADRRTWLTSALGLPATDPRRYSWEPVKPGDPDHMPNGQRLLHVVADRIQWQTALAEARRRAGEAGEKPSATVGEALWGQG
jgi:replication initiator protein RepSA